MEDRGNCVTHNFPIQRFATISLMFDKSNATQFSSQQFSVLFFGSNGSIASSSLSPPRILLALVSLRVSPIRCCYYFFRISSWVCRRQDHHTSRDNMAENLPPPNSTANCFTRTNFIRKFCRHRRSRTLHSPICSLTLCHTATRCSHLNKHVVWWWWWC